MECSKLTSGLNGSSLHGHQNTADRTGTRLKRRHSASPESRFVVQRFRLAVSFICWIGKRNRSIGHCVDSPRCSNFRRTVLAYFACCKHDHFLTNGTHWDAQFPRTDITKFLSSLAIVLEEREDPACRSV
ncbi:hypothetical protein TNCV_3735651 [Trichonephila clavipes]|nr:hypothetical protein TNCV_3735651 [Trichonephila clavipes]